MTPRTFAVWAPHAEAVELVIGAGDAPRRRLPMRRGARGWWTSDEPEVPGTRYAYSLDGGPPRPDPRSRSQPDGVHAPSEVVDPRRVGASAGRVPRSAASRAWRGVPLAGSVLYELHVGTFTPEGTFDAAIDRLDHLVELGVDAVELMPVAAFPGVHGWGYDGVALRAVHAPYGGPAGLRRFVDACHDRGLGVVLDIVLNHLGPSGNHLAEFGPYFSTVHHTNWGAALNLDGPGSDEVRRFLVDVALGWLRDHDLDGLRLDAVHALVDDSAVHLLEQLAEEVDALAAHLGRPLFLVAESDRNDPRDVRPREAGGYGLHAVWADEWHHALHAVLTGERSGYYEDFGTLDDLAVALGQAWVYAGRYSPHRRRVHGRPPTGLPGDRFVVSVQNHDQVGNRAAGERLGALVGEGRLRVAAALLLTSPFTPMLFQGEEWAATTPFRYFTDHDDPELARAVSEGRRREFAAFGWDPAEVPDPQDPATHRASVLDWDEPARDPHAGVLDWYRRLLALRRARPELTDPRPGCTEVQVGPDPSASEGWVRVRRGAIEVLANLGPTGVRLPVPSGACPLLASDASARLERDRAHLPPDSVVLVEHRGDGAGGDDAGGGELGRDAPGREDVA
ncbi:MAG TPA: malto-oligosyltrehalose trehalohydrolase [Microthrixaceae bacterium]|nr:malto-oligosyltrehalose trehalohydrolase [Microthrixaceae bacterium]